MPKLANIKVRRTWRGLYPMTPDGSPIIGRARELEGYIHAVGMCGQGYMLGPGVGTLLTRMLTDKETEADAVTLKELTPYRTFAGHRSAEVGSPPQVHRQTESHREQRVGRQIPDDVAGHCGNGYGFV